MTKKNVIICFNPHNSRGNTVIPSSIVREFAYSGEESKPTQEKKHYGVVTIKDIKRFSDFFEQSHVPIEMIHRLLSEFQAQKITSFKGALKYIMKYDYKRIHRLEKSMPKNLRKILEDSLTSRYEAVFESQDISKRH